MVSYDARVFRSIANSDGGDVNGATTFQYQQRGNVVWATYAGGSVVSGTLLAKADDSGNLEMRYQHVSIDGTFKSGRCQSRPETLPDGRLRLHERWKWTDGADGEGESIIEEVTTNALVPGGTAMDIREKVTRLYSEYAAGHLDAVMAELPDNFCFVWPFDPTTARYSGIAYTKDELGKKLGDLLTSFTIEQYTHGAIIVDGERAAAQLSLRLTSRREGGRSFEASIAHFWTFKNGEPTQLVEYMDTAVMASESLPATDTTVEQASR